MPSLLPLQMAHLPYDPSLFTVNPSLSLSPLKLHSFAIMSIAMDRIRDIVFTQVDRKPKAKKATLVSRCLCSSITAFWAHVSLFFDTCIPLHIFHLLSLSVSSYLPILTSVTGSNARPDRQVVDLCSQHATVSRYKAIARHQEAV